MTCRRAFIASALGVLAAPLATEAQQLPKVPRIGVLEANPGFDNAFHDGLRIAPNAIRVAPSAPTNLQIR
jgi:hypothetical protein